MNERLSGFLRVACVFALCAVGWMPAARGERPAEAPAAAPGDDASSPDATAILEAMGRAYLNCKTYRDTGISTMRFLSDLQFETKTEFRTAFRRPTDFRFEYSDDGMPGNMENRMIILRDASGTRTWWSVSADEGQTSFRMAIARATGVSGGTAFTVPSMLMPDEIGGARFRDDKSWTKQADGEEAGRGCYRVTHKTEPVDSETLWTETLWIDKASSMLVRLDEARTIEGDRGPFKTEQTTLYRPEMDVEILETDLALGAPTGK